MNDPVADKWATDAFDFKERHMDPSVAAAISPYLQHITSNLTPNLDPINAFTV
jgi:hypothetical protein